LIVIKPFIALYALIWFLMWSTDKNFIKNNFELNGIKRNAITKTFHVPTLKKIA